MSDILHVCALIKNLTTVEEFILSKLTPLNLAPDISLQIQLIVEEVFCNIANYAYAPGTGDVDIYCSITPVPDSTSQRICLRFEDSGIPYNPLNAPTPDISLSADERPIGGLGVFLTKEFMDYLDYQYENGKNIFLLQKII